MIKLENVTMHFPVQKRYIHYIIRPFKNEFYHALHCTNLEINAGDRVAFLGSNGAGKTTLLKIISGLLYPASGNAIVNNYNTVTDNLRARKRVGFVLNEERSFYWRLTGIENLLFFGALDNLHGEMLKERVNYLIGLMGLGDAKNKPFAGYSSGMKQKLAIARGLLSDPEILILDEPTRTLDPISAEDILEIISKRIHKKKERTLLIATHSLTEATALCNKVCIMTHGRVLIYSTTQDIINQYGTLKNCYKVLLDT